MTPQDFETVKSLWAWVQARDAFRLAKETADYMAKNNIRKGHELFEALTTCISVSYGKPFKRSKGINVVSAKIVPKEFQALHELLITHRDKHHAHKDAGAFVLGTIPRQNDVLAIVKGRTLKWGVNQLDLKPEGIVMVRKLAGVLEEKCIHWSIRYDNRLRTKASLRDGCYRLNIEDPNGDILMPSKIEPRHTAKY